MIEKIGTNAGLVWHALEAGKLELKAIKKATKLTEKEITEKVYKYNISAFFEKAYILEWEKDCIREKSTINTRWNYVIKCEGMPTIENCGKDYFPPYYKQAKLRHDYYSINFERKKL